MINKLINDSARTGDLATPEDFTDPDEIYKVLIEKIKAYREGMRACRRGKIQKRGMVTVHMGAACGNGKKRTCGAGVPYL